MSGFCCRLTVVVACLLGPLAALAAPAAQVGQVAQVGKTFVVPQEARQLLPAQPAAIFAGASLNELADQYVDLLRVMNDADDASRTDVINLVFGLVPPLAEWVDLDRPLFVAAGLPNLMGGTAPPLTFIVPLRADAPAPTALNGLEIYAGNAFAGTETGRYAAVSHAPDYAPAAVPPPLAAHLAAGVLAVSLDLEQVLLAYGPFVEMGLSGIPVRPADAPADSLPGGLSAAEAAALSQMARQVMDSVTRLDFGLGRDQDRLAWHTGLGVRPGSALDPGLQPDFARALALAAALPADADFHQVAALDQRRLFDTFRDYYVMTMMSSLENMDPAQADRYRVWVEQYLAAMDIWSSPMAAALRLDDLGAAGQMIIEIKDAEKAAARLADLLDGVSDLQVGYDLTALPAVKIAGVKFRSWSVELDFDQFTALLPQTGPATGAMTGPGALEAEQIVAILGKILPVIYLGAKDGKVFLAADDDIAELETVVKAAGKRGPVPAEVAASAAWAGPHCRQVITGDLLAIINWMTEWYNELDDLQLEVVRGNPIPFRSVFGLDGTEFAFDLSMDLPALARLAAAIEQLETLSGDGGGDGGSEP